MLQKLGIVPGFNKQVSDTGAEGQWIDGDNIRFRYGSPEKIGGCLQLGGDKLTGAARALHHWDNNAGLKYAAIGTNRILYAFSAGTYYDIHPIRLTLTSCTFASDGTKTVTVTCSATHSLKDDDIVLFSNTTIPGGSSLSAATFNGVKFMVTSVPTSTTFTITLPANVTGTTLASGNTSTTIQIYYSVGPAQQVSGFGFGTGIYGGTIPGVAANTLATALTDTTTTNIVLASSNLFPASGTIRIGTEDISYTANNTGTNTLSGGARSINGTTATTHSQNAVVTNISLFVGWGDASTNVFPFDPGLWVLDNFGTKLIALIYNGECFEWDAAPTNATSVRATIIANAPTASRHVLVSTPDRHLVFFGTETTIGDKSSQDNMFIRFSNQENINEYTVKAENTAGTQRLAAGSKIMGAFKGRDAIYIWSDTSLFLMQFVGQPFTFAFSQVGNNCGLIGKNASAEVDGLAYWMSENGFFVYDGQLKSMPCLVEDYVFDDLNTIPRDLIYAGTNNLFGEISWFYPTLNSEVLNRNVTYNYIDSTAKQPIWTTGTLARTTWQDSAVFDKPHATEYNANDNASSDVVGNTEGSSIYFKQETGTDQITSLATTTIAATITSGDFDITQKRSSTGAVAGMPDIRGDGEYIMRISRFIPDFISQTGAAQVSFLTKDYSNSVGVTTNFTDITENTLRKDVRLRARSIAIKVSNTGAGEDWKLGTFKLDIHPGGRR